MRVSQKLYLVFTIYQESTDAKQKSTLLLLVNFEI